MSAFRHARGALDRPNHAGQRRDATVLNGTTALRVSIIVLLGCWLPSAGRAQESSEQPITRYAVDLRAALPKVPADNALADPYGLSGANLPGLGLGVDIGGHVYPIRWKSVTFGVGLSGVVGRSHTTATIAQADNTTVSKRVTARFSALSPQLSFNFGSAAGWSYLSGGIGTSRLAIETPDTAGDESPRRKTINYGGGGRWFVRDRMAVTFDIRFYAMNPIPPAGNVKQSPRLRMLVISAGISLR